MKLEDLDKNQLIKLVKVLEKNPEKYALLKRTRKYYNLPINRQHGGAFKYTNARGISYSGFQDLEQRYIKSKDTLSDEDKKILYEGWFDNFVRIAIGISKKSGYSPNNMQLLMNNLQYYADPEHIKWLVPRYLNWYDTFLIEMYFEDKKHPPDTLLEVYNNFIIKYSKNIQESTTRDAINALQLLNNPNRDEWKKYMFSKNAILKTVDAMADKIVKETESVVDSETGEVLEVTEKDFPLSPKSKKL